MNKSLLRIISAASALLLLLSSLVCCTSGGNSGNTDGSGTGPADVSSADTEKPAEQIVESDIVSWCASSLDKTKGETKMPKKAASSYTVKMAKNEHEACQIVMRSESKVTGLSLEVQGEYDGIKAEILKEYLVPVKEKDYSDPLSGLKGTFMLMPNKTAAFWVRFTTEKDCKADNYEYRVTLRNKEGQLLGAYDITVSVWDFAIPDKYDFYTAVGINKRSIAYFEVMKDSKPREAIEGDVESILEGKDEAETARNHEKYEEILLKYYDMLYDYGLCPMDLPYPVLDDRADKYLNDPRVTTVRIDHEMSDEDIVATYNKLKSNPEWFEKAYIYCYDEPYSEKMVYEQEEINKRMRELCPGVPTGVAYYTNCGMSNGQDQLDYMAEYIDIFVPKIFMFQDAAYSERLQQKKADGKKIWSYVCWEPGKPYVNLYLNESTVDHRLLFWQIYQNGGNGFLYWSVNEWTCTFSPWGNMATVPWVSEEVFGDGSLLYDGHFVGSDHPESSIRLETVRDGIEDFELFLLAAETIGEEELGKIMYQASQSVRDYTQSSEDFFTQRNLICEKLAEALAK